MTRGIAKGVRLLVGLRKRGRGMKFRLRASPKNTPQSRAFSQAYRFFRSKPGLSEKEARQYATDFVSGKMERTRKGIESAIGERRNLAWQREWERLETTELRAKLKKSVARQKELDDKVDAGDGTPEKRRQWGSEARQLNLKNIEMRQWLEAKRMQRKKQIRERLKDQTEFRLTERR